MPRGKMRRAAENAIKVETRKNPKTTKAMNQPVPPPQEYVVEPKKPFCV